MKYAIFAQEPGIDPVATMITKMESKVWKR